jgi:hypothetical protein
MSWNRDLSGFCQSAIQACRANGGFAQPRDLQEFAFQIARLGELQFHKVIRDSKDVWHNGNLGSTKRKDISLNRSFSASSKSKTAVMSGKVKLAR